MIKSILVVNQETLDFVSDVPKLTLHDYNVVEMLTPFEKATDFSQAENQPSAGNVILCIRGLQYQLFFCKRIS